MDDINFKISEFLNKFESYTTDGYYDPCDLGGGGIDPDKLKIFIENLNPWQPIETAPKDGTRILVLNERMQRHWVAAWRFDCWQIIDEYSCEPTHWRKLT